MENYHGISRPQGQGTLAGAPDRQAGEQQTTWLAALVTMW